MKRQLTTFIFAVFYSWTIRTMCDCNCWPRYLFMGW